MTTEQTAQQLELAAQILRTGHPFEVRHDTSDKWHASLGINPAQAVLQNWHLRPILATPPDNRPLHNPDNLTAEQVGVGYRLTLPDEELNRNYEYWLSYGGWKQGNGQGAADFLNRRASMRLPLSVPWPKPQPDPYAELKKAHAEGKVIEFRPKVGKLPWVEDKYPEWADHMEYRIKPEPTFQLPPPPPGMQWHRTDGWQEGDLPQGMRPLFLGEPICEQVDEWKQVDENSNTWVKRIRVYPDECTGAQAKKHSLHRTRRPLTFTHEGKTWTWHKVGELMPCDGNKEIHYIDTKKACYGPELPKNLFTEFGASYPWPIIGWRYADENKTVQLGPEDVPPGSAFRVNGCVPNTWHAVVGTYATTLHLDTNRQIYAYSELCAEWQINRSIPLTGKWNPDSWEPCHKLISENG